MRKESVFSKIGVFTKALGKASLENGKSLLTMPGRAAENIGNKLTDIRELLGGKGLNYAFAHAGEGRSVLNVVGKSADDLPRNGVQNNFSKVTGSSNETERLSSKLGNDTGKYDQYGKVSAEYRGVTTADDVQKVAKVEEGQFTDQSVKDIAKLASNNPEADTTTLGKWHPDSSSYEQVAYEKGNAYYDLGADGWNAAQDALEKKGIANENQIKQEMWRINQQYLDDRIKAGNTFEFTSDPSVLKRGTYGIMEAEYLVDNGYHLVKDGDVWRMIK